MWAGQSISPVSLGDVEESVINNTDGTQEGTVIYRNASGSTSVDGSIAGINKKSNSNTTAPPTNGSGSTLISKTFFQKYKWPLIGGAGVIGIVGILVARKLIKGKNK